MLKHKFVEFIPDIIEKGFLYISIEYCTAIHKCVCGCGNEVVTPLSPEGWKLIFNGKTVSLYPSIGNWNFICQSHYWIKNNNIQYAGHWTKEEINEGRINDLKRKEEYYNEETNKQNKLVKTPLTIWQKIFKLF